MLKQVIHTASTVLWFKISHSFNRYDAYPEPIYGLIFSKYWLERVWTYYSPQTGKFVKSKSKVAKDSKWALLSDGHTVNWHSCGIHYHVTLSQGIPSHAAPERGDTESLENRPLIKNYEGLPTFLRRQTSWGTRGTTHDVTDFPTNDPTTHKSFVCLGSRGKGWSHNGIVGWGSNPTHVTMSCYRDCILSFSVLIPIDSINLLLQLRLLRNNQKLINTGFSISPRCLIHDYKNNGYCEKKMYNFTGAFYWEIKKIVYLMPSFES